MMGAVAQSLEDCFYIIYLQSSGGNQKKEDCYGKTKNQCFLELYEEGEKKFKDGKVY